MGVFWSCCRRDKSPEKAPLLPKGLPAVEPPHSAFDKLADIIGAVNSKKLPSQDQVAGFLQHALRSEFLRDPGHVIPTHGGALSQRGIVLVLELRELVDSVLRIGLEKNYDNKLQELLYQSSRSSSVPMKVSGELLVDGAPVSLENNSSQEITNDADDFMQSLKTLAQLAITSSAFRMLMSDMLATTREIVAETASEIGQVASQVQAAAVDVAKTAELDNLTVDGLKGKAEESYSGLEQSVGHAHRNIGTLGDDSAERVRDLVVGRVQEIVIQAHQNPQHQTAIRTILILLNKYSGKLTAIAESAEQPVTIDAQVEVSPPFYEAVVDFKTLLERLASGRSLDPLLHMFKAAVADVIDAPTEAATEVKQYFGDLGRWVERALAEPQFAASRLGARSAEQLYDTGRLLLASEANAQWAHDMRNLVAEAQSFVQALESDAATQRLIKSVHSVLSALRGLAQDAVFSGAGAQRKWREELLKDALGWFVPRVLKSVRALPMPRVEFQNSAFDVAIDALLLTSASTSASFAPDHIWAQNWSEVKVDMAAGAAPETSSRTRVHVDGMRCGAHGFGYYFKYKGPIQYSDEGVLDVDVGHAGAVGQGLTVDVEIETTQQERDTPGAPLFRLVDVNVAVPGLGFTINHSKHWILNNAILQPVAAPIVRLVLKNILEQQIRSGVEWADRLVSAVTEEAVRINTRRHESGESSPSMEDYWSATVLTAPAFFDKREPGLTVETQTHTEPTLTGIVYTTTTLPDDPSASSPPEQTVLAVGGGAQLFPNKGGPYGVNEVTAGDVAREAVNEIQGAVDRSVGKTREVVGAVEDESLRIRGDIERAEERKLDRERLESSRGGWRSEAFDFGAV
ncbi:hypothetical protein B0H17DRAFT_1145095 [Mycena rosella]|uniref:Uncharacterized protein n=2 Tax=Mycena rosella TaxID=1033263 RepID=A0AAD7CSS3_MYCRO|nr:hypothetical protein B0H17DRAFT_1145095 [Mycena rosella]